MKKSILVSLLWTILQVTAFGQVFNEKIMYIVDSIPVIEDPEAGNEILQREISNIIVVKDKENSLFKANGAKERYLTRFP
jgi:hypothetical protein